MRNKKNLIEEVSGNVKTDGSSSEPNSSQVISFTFAWKSFIAGGVAGMCAKTSIAPLDRIKILLQAHSIHYKDLGILTGLRQMIQKESYLALYKGNGAQMIRIFPYAATQFTSFELYKQFLAGILGPKSHVSKFCAGSLAGVTAVAFTYPLDVVRAKLAFQVKGGHMYKGILHALTTIFYKEGGFMGLYRGFTPTIMGMIPYAGLSFYSFEFLKYVCIMHFPLLTTKPNPNRQHGKILCVHAKLLCGGLAGAVAQSVAYPLDVTRRRMQLSMMSPETYKYSKHWYTTLMLIYQENGIVKGLYRGMSVNYLRAVPMVAVSFSTYEIMKQMLRLDTGLDF